MDIYTCDRPLCIDDAVMQVRELKFRWRGRYTWLRNGKERDLCERHGQGVIADNANTVLRLA